MGGKRFTEAQRNMALELSNDGQSHDSIAAAMAFDRPGTTAAQIASLVGRTKRAEVPTAPNHKAPRKPAAKRKDPGAKMTIAFKGSSVTVKISPSAALALLLDPGIVEGLS